MRINPLYPPIMGEIRKYRGNHVGASLKLTLAWDLKRGEEMKPHQSAKKKRSTSTKCFLFGYNCAIIHVLRGNHF
jgi:hypothetical protein